jgi:hypothetical protein
MVFTKICRVLLLLLLVLIPAQAMAGIIFNFDLDAASPDNGFTLGGVAASDTLTVNLIDGQFTAWNAWNSNGSTTCPTGGNASCRGWITLFDVTTTDGTDRYTLPLIRYSSPAEALAAYNPISLTGFESYDFKILDTNSYGSNAGGLSFSVTVNSVPAPATLALFSIGLAAIGWRKKARR